MLNPMGGVCVRHRANLNAQRRYRCRSRWTSVGRGAATGSLSFHRLLGATALLVLILVAIAPASAQTPSVLVRSGPVLATDEGFFNDTDVGWSIQVVTRQPIARPGETGYLFLDLGGSFMAINGDDDPIITSGNVNILRSGAVQVVRLDDLLSTRLRQLRRASVDMAIGWHHNPPGRNSRTGSLLQLTVRGGGRFGHMHGKFTSEATPSLNAVLAGLQQGDIVSVSSDFSKNDTFGGLFGGVGMAVNTRRVCTRALGALDVSWGVDAEFAFDWIDFKNFEDDGLGTAAILLNWSVSR